MISSGSKWVDADAGLTTAGSPPGRVLKYNVEGEEIYVAFVAASWGGTYSNTYWTSGILAFVSTAWDSTDHCPSGTCECTQIPIYGSTGGSRTDFANYNWQYWMWYEEDILVLITQAASTSNEDSVALFAMEHNVTKEYDDGASDFFIYATAQSVGYITAGKNPSRYAWGVPPRGWTLPSAWGAYMTAIRKYIHPFQAAYPQVAVGGYDFDGAHNFPEGQDLGGQSRCLIPARGRKSTGNNKVYMAFPVVYADPTETYRIPIATMKSFFPVDVDTSIADGDLINVPVSWAGAPADTWQYIYKRLISPDGGELTVAIKYAEPEV